jgi:cell division protein FtsN
MFPSLFETPGSNKLKLRSHEQATHGAVAAPLLLGSDMKNILAVLLIAVAIAYYFGYDVTDFIPSFSGNSRPTPKARRAPAPAEQAQNAAPVQSSSTSAVTTNSSDGSLADRWSPYPSPSPKRP